MSDIMQKGRDANKFLQKMTRRDVGDSLAKRRIKSSYESTCQVHGSKRMLEARVGGTRENVLGKAQLFDTAQTLHILVIDSALQDWIKRHVAVDFVPNKKSFSPLVLHYPRAFKARSILRLTVSFP